MIGESLLNLEHRENWQKLPLGSLSSHFHQKSSQCYTDKASRSAVICLWNTNTSRWETRLLPNIKLNLWGVDFIVCNVFLMHYFLPIGFNPKDECWLFFVKKIFIFIQNDKNITGCVGTLSYTYPASTDTLPAAIPGFRIRPFFPPRYDVLVFLLLKGFPILRSRSRSAFLL